MTIGLIYDFDDTLAPDHEETIASIDEVGIWARDSLRAEPERLRGDLLGNAVEL